jgi:hypothetical protein
MLLGLGVLMSVAMMRRGSIQLPLPCKIWGLTTTLGHSDSSYDSATICRCFGLF